MKFGDFLFPESSDPACDGEIIDDALAEARLCDELGMDAIWLAEHHFDGNCAYVDPLTFAAALAVATKRAELGFAVLQTSLYHPIRLAEQLSLLDHLSKGRLILGLGRGTFFNIYEYQGYGIDADEVQARFEEAEEILRKAWTSEVVRAPGQILESSRAGPAAAPVYQAASRNLPGNLQRKLAQGLRPAGPADPAKSANQRDDAAAGGYLSARHARGWL